MAGEGAALASAFLWAVSNILMGSQAGRVPAAVISALRAVFGGVVLLLVVVTLTLVGATQYPSVARMLALAGSGALGLGLGDTLYIGSLRRVGVSRAFPISMAVYPLLTFALAVALLGERLSLQVALGTVLILAGVYLIVRTGGSAAPEESLPRDARALEIGVGMVLVASVLWACASVWLRSAAEGVQPVLVTAVRMPIAALVTIGVACSAGHTLRPRAYGGRNVAVMAVNGVLGTGAGSLLFVLAVQHAGAAKTAVLSSTAPLFALPMAALLLGERVTGRVAAGTALSIAGIWLVV